MIFHKIRSWRRLTFLAFLQIFNVARSEFVEKHFDFLTFSQMWPITECEMWQSKGIYNTCFLPNESKFAFAFQRTNSSHKKNCLYFQKSMESKKELHCLCQSWDAYAPTITLMWPASYVWSFLTSCFYKENMWKSQKISV